MHLVKTPSGEPALIRRALLHIIPPGQNRKLFTLRLFSLPLTVPARGVEAAAARASKDPGLLKRYLPKEPASFWCAAPWLRARGAAPRRPAGRTGLRAIGCWIIAATAALGPLPALAQVELPPPDSDEPIVVSAEAANHWRQGSYEVWVLRGNCRIRQGSGSARSNEAALWIDYAPAAGAQRSKIIAYLEGDVQIEPDPQGSPARLTDQRWFGRFYTSGGIQVHAAQVAGEPAVKPAVYQRGLQRRSPPSADAVRRAQFTNSAAVGPNAAESMPAGTRRVRVFTRSEAPVQAKSGYDPQSNQWIAWIDGGVNLIVDGLPRFGSIDVSADRLVIWMSGLEKLNLTGETFQDETIPLEIYMEGNIVFRQGERVIHASRMYYDVTNRVGTVLHAEMLTPVRKYEGLLRLRAEVLQQVGEDRFFAHDTFITSSRMGHPGYRIQSAEVYYEDIQSPAFEPFTGQPAIDPETGQPAIDHQKLATSRNNFLFLGPVPIFYWPTLATDLDDPTFYIRRARFKNDRVYGTQILTDWDAYQLLGIRNPPDGTEWDLSFDYLGDRGFGHGTTFLYTRDWLPGVPGPASGLFDFWGIKDHGLDNLGRGRYRLTPEKDYRYRLFWRHRQQLPGDFRLSAELGWISDRNFLEQYYEREWDELKDKTTGLELKRVRENRSWSVTADVRLNDFFTQTEWLPRADHFWLGQPLAGDVFTWYEHSHVGYARLRTTSEPPPKDGPFDWLPWEKDVAGGPLSASGERLATRQEIDWPLQLGPVKLVPYALGELAHWGEDRTGDDLQRAYWQAGMRTSMPMWRANPMVESTLLNVHGLAHKVVFDAEFSFADSNRDLDDLPLYDPLDDDSVEAFRRRFATVSPWLDERYYALRAGMGGWVTSPSTEIADDLMALRMGVRQRWQTKRGMPGQRRIIDWIVLDTNATWFPDDTRDNFGKGLGLVDYDFRWHVGDRLTLLSDGIFDFFPDGQQVVTFGGCLSRPPRGSLYLGMRLLEGPISHQVLTVSYSYWMSPKWITSFGTSVDLRGEGNIGQRFSITRIGESLLISAGFTVDAARDNVGVNLAIEPRFLPKSRLGRVGGAQIPVAGTFGLE